MAQSVCAEKFRRMAKTVVPFVLLVASGQASAVDLSVTGFGSFVGGTLLRGDGYIADYPNLAVYGDTGQNPSTGEPYQFAPKDNGWLSQETRFGLQGMVTLDDATRVTVQMTARGTDAYDPKVQWLYATRDLGDNITAQVGKMRLPVYFFSDRMDVGFSYPWLRVPSDSYSLETVNYDGARVNYNQANDDFSMKLSAYAGSAQVTDSKLMSYLFSNPVDGDVDISRKFSNIHGFVADAVHGVVNLRLSYMQTQLTQSTRNAGASYRNQKFNEEFYDAAVQLDLGALKLIGEYNRDRPFYDSWMMSAIYRIGQNSFYAVHSQFMLDELWEKHNQMSIGVRHDIGSSMDIKLDVTKIDDDGSNPFTGNINPVIKRGTGNATLLSASFDFIF